MIVLYSCKERSSSPFAIVNTETCIILKENYCEGFLINVRTITLKYIKTISCV